MTTVSPVIAPARYRIDPARSTVRFTVAQLFGLATVRGTVRIIEGAVLVAAEPGRCRVAAVLDPASFDTGNRRRDDHVRSRRFLDVGRYPTIRFTSREVSATTVTGVLTVGEIGQRITLGLAPSATGDECRFGATTRVDRYAFGVTSARGAVGRFLELDLDITATRC